MIFCREKKLTSGDEKCVGILVQFRLDCKMLMDLHKHTRILYLLLDEKGQIRSANAGTRRLFPESSRDQQNWKESLCERDYAKWDRLFSDVPSWKMGDTRSVLLSHKNCPTKTLKSRGREHWANRLGKLLPELCIQWEVTLVRSTGGAEKCWEWVGYDRTQEVYKRHSLLYSKGLREAFQNATQTLFFYKDTQGRFLDCNQAVCDFLQKDKGAILGQTDSDLLASHNYQVVHDANQIVMETGELYASVEKFDEDRVYEFYRFPIQWKGKIVGIGGMGMDISFQIKSQMNLSSTILENKAIIDAIPDLVFIVNGNKEIVEYGAKSQEALLVQPLDFLGKGFHEFLPPELARKMERVMMMSELTDSIQIVEYSLKSNKGFHYFEARCLKYLQDRFLFLIRDITKVKMEQIEFQNDLDMARDLQLSTLPKSENLESEDLGVSVVFNPLGSVSGDIYDFYSLGDRKYRFVIIDAVGHGIQSALLTMALRTEMERIKFNPSLTPGEFLTLLNRGLVSTFKSRENTCSSCVVDLDFGEKSIRYSMAGHPNQFLIQRDSNLESFGAMGPLLGLVPQYRFSTSSLVWKEGFELILFTDGIYEFIDTAGNLFSEEQLADAVAGVYQERNRSGSFGSGPISQSLPGRESMAMEIFNVILGLTKENKLRDDLTLLHIYSK